MEKDENIHISVVPRLKNYQNIDRASALKLLEADTQSLLSLAASIRDLTKGKVITYSRKVFLPVSNLCSDRCSYCGYRKEPEDGGGYIKEEEASALIRAGTSLGCTEALIMAGERPERRYSEARSFLNKNGFSSTVEYAMHLAEIALKHGILPHINIGLLEENEMIKLKKVSASMGLMLESTSLKLFAKGGPHHFSPSKNPSLRLKMMEVAGKLKIPFTTGLLLGIGEEPEDIIDSLFAIRELNEKYGHIQEVIVQPFRPEKGTPMENVKGPSLEIVEKTIALARLVLGPDMNIQAPPNLVPCWSVIEAGGNDLGGISPLTIDYVNSSYPWPDIKDLGKECESYGYILKKRLPVYREFINKPGFLEERVADVIRRLSL
ncbi:MAG: 7,8-didemethyl-8-hydroxy-5-deazariboflavin synthase CofG [Nitrososphaeria archaeon]